MKISLISKGKIEQTNITPTLTALYFEKQDISENASSYEILANIKTSSWEQVHFVQLSSTSTNVGSTTTGTRADKLRLKTLSKENKIAAGLDSISTELVIWKANYDFLKLLAITGILDFDLLQFSSRLYLIYLRRNQKGIFYRVVSLDDEKVIAISEEYTFQLQQAAQEQYNYLNCRADLSSKIASCAVNSSGVFLSSFDIPFEEMDKLKKDAPELQNLVFEKTPGFDGSQVTSDQNFVVHRVFNYSPEAKLGCFVNVYSKTSASKDKAGKLHIRLESGISTEENSILIEKLKMGMDFRAIEQKVLQNTPLNQGAFHYQKEGQSFVGIKSQIKENLVDVYSLTSSVMLNIAATESAANTASDFSAYTLMINGVKQEYNIQEMLENKRIEPKSSSSSSSSQSDSGKGFFGLLLWILVILIGVSLVAGIAWLVYKRSNNSHKNDDYSKSGYEELNRSEKSDTMGLDLATKSKRNSTITSSELSDSNASELKKIQ